jgi:hypothetical protein
MNKIVTAAAAAALLTGAAFAQEIQTTGQGFQTIKVMGAIKGSPVKGAPYSGEEIAETTQMLADGTRIHQENKTTVYRDSEGRTRRETPNSIMISDPVANVTYMLNTKTMSGNKIAMASGNFMMNRTNTVTSSTGATSFSFTTTADGAGEPKVFIQTGTIDVAGNPDEAKVKAEARSAARLAEAKAVAEQGALYNQDMVKVKMAAAKAGEPLGKQMMEGVQAEGTRHVTTIQPGDIGNDRPIQITTESWYSPDLKLTVMTKHSDPRTGDESFRLTNINRTEPAPYLFQVPAGFQVSDRK